MSYLADRITQSPEKSYGMAGRAAALTSEEFIHLELGRRSHNTPDFIKEATIRALLAGKVHYGDFRGEPQLRNALAQKLPTFNGIQASPEQVLVTNGLTQASFAAFMATINPGDEVICSIPIVRSMWARSRSPAAHPYSRRWMLPTDSRSTPALIEARVTSRTKAIVLVDPCNPTGRVYSRQELEGLAQLCIRHDLLVISDEVYEYITFNDHAHVSVAALPGMAQRTISMFAFTKAYAMDGWRLGYVTASPELIEGMLKITTSEVTHVNRFIQDGALAAVVDGAAAVRSMLDDDRRKRDLVVTPLARMRGVRCATPQGTIYAFPDISATGWSSPSLADALLQQCRVIVEAGSFYGQGGEGYLRICFGSQSLPRLEAALERMHTFFERLEFRIC